MSKMKTLQKLVEFHTYDFRNGDTQESLEAEITALRRMVNAVKIDDLAQDQLDLHLGDLLQDYLHGSGMSQNWWIKKQKWRGSSHLAEFILKKKTSKSKITIMFLFAEEAEDEIEEKGPWKVEMGPKGPFIMSDDFTHDVILRIDGDFRNPDEKLKYVNEITRRLNFWNEQHPLTGHMIPESIEKIPDDRD